MRKLDQSKIYVFFVTISFLLMLGALVRDVLYEEARQTSVVNESWRKNQSFNLEYFDIIKWP